jgi:DNA polymerase V
MRRSTLQPSFRKEGGVLVLDRPEVAQAVRARLDVEDVWGIGRRWGALLRGQGIRTALDLRNAPDRWIRKNLHIVGLRTVHELRDPPRSRAAAARVRRRRPCQW